jgi:hypothetical protein
VALAFANLADVARIVEFADTWSARDEFHYLRAARHLDPLSALIDVNRGGFGGSALDGAV